MEYKSERASTCSPRACSGDRYWAVPTTAFVCVIVACESVIARAIPKSMTFTLPSFVNMMLPGLISRCTKCCEWEYSSAPNTPDTMATASLIGTGVPSASSSLTVCPSTYSITMYGTEIARPSGPVSISSPVSYTATIFAWFKEAADCASRLKRAWNTESRARSERSILIATTRDRRVSKPRWTSAIPPRPISERTSYLPARRRPMESAMSEPPSWWGARH
ncbi:Uncharacterised protein [Chlamydia trachomatis]|nr:Uncharacterised protein [Chlamydia trachomatis]